MLAFYWFLCFLWSIVVTPHTVSGKIAGISPYLCVSLVKLANENENEKDAMTQGRKDWKPRNPSESGILYPTPSYVLVEMAAPLLRRLCNLVVS